MTEKNNKVNYADLLELGFKKVNCSDDRAHYHQYGYPYFFLSYGNDMIIMEWSPTDREVNLYLNSHLYQKGLTLDEVKKVIYCLSTQ